MYVLIIFHTSIPEKHVLVSELEILQPEQGVFFRFIKNGPSGTFFLYPKTISSWWFQRFFIFTHIWGRFPFWLIFFKWVETTNQICLCKHIVVHKDLVIFVPIGYLSSSKMALLQPPQGWGPLIINPIYTLYSGYIYIYILYIYIHPIFPNLCDLASVVSKANFCKVWIYTRNKKSVSMAHGHLPSSWPSLFQRRFPFVHGGVRTIVPPHRPGNGCSSLHCHGAAISVPVELKRWEPGRRLFVFCFFSTNFFECPKVAGRFGSRKGTGCLKPFRIKQLLKHVVFLPALSDILQFFGGANHLFCDDCHETDPTPLREILLVLADYWELLGTYFWIPSIMHEGTEAPQDCDRTSTGSNACIHA